jgi:hypothetical protein
MNLCMLMRQPSCKYYSVYCSQRKEVWCKQSHSILKNVQLCAMYYAREISVLYVEMYPAWPKWSRDLAPSTQSTCPPPPPPAWVLGTGQEKSDGESQSLQCPLYVANLLYFEKVATVCSRRRMIVSLKLFIHLAEM